MNKNLKKINSKNFTENERINNNFPSNYVLVGSYRKFKDYYIDSDGTIFAGNKEGFDEVFFNSTDVLNSIYGFGKKAYSIFKEDLKSNLKNNFSKDDKIKYITPYDFLLDKETLINNFVNKFINLDTFKSHLEELEPLLLEFCQKNGLPDNSSSDYFEINNRVINPWVIRFREENKIPSYFHPRVEEFCKKNNIMDCINCSTSSSFSNPLVYEFCIKNSFSSYFHLPLKKYGKKNKIPSYFHPRVEEFCKKNNIPSYLHPNIEKFCEENTLDFIINEVTKVYYCDSKPFVSLSIIIYILFETQDCIKQIIENASKKPSENNSTIIYMYEDDFDISRIDEYTKRLKPILWFFYGNKKSDFKKLDIYELAQFVTCYYELIEKQTSYIKFTSVPRFFFSENKFGIEEIQENLLSVAWSRLKLSMLTSNTKICKNPKCNKIFEPKSPQNEYCKECNGQKINKNVNSSNSYYKKQTLHKKLVELFNSTEKSKLDTLDINTMKQIEKCVSYRTATQVKNNTEIELIQKYIDLLLDLK